MSIFTTSRPWQTRGTRANTVIAACPIIETWIIRFATTLMIKWNELKVYSIKQQRRWNWKPTGIYIIIALFLIVFTFRVSTETGTAHEWRRFGTKFESTRIITLSIIYALTIRIRGARRLGVQDTGVASIPWVTIYIVNLYVSWKSSNSFHTP